MPSSRKIKLFIFVSLIFTQVLCAQNNSTSIKHNPWELIIYRPENNGDLNYVRCWIKLEDAETGEDVTYTKGKATYEWASIPNVVNNYQRTYYLDGGMAAHFNLKSGKYNITVYTPKDKTEYFTSQNPCSNDDDWISNTFYYDTNNPTKVIFVVPTADENGFYDGGWYIDYKAPQFFKFTKAKQ
ncbi:MAG: hypothetical protein J6X78_10490 [Treponema sp.]|nr:hypothetical protein [Treponema sp.]